MTFLNPLLLAGMAAIAVPIVIHMLNRQRVQRLRWAAMRFLRVSIERNQRRIRIEDILLLILRCLLILLLALALARPTFQSAASVNLGRTPIQAVIVLDNSYSMGATDGVQSRFDRARNYSETIVDALPAGSAVAVVLASDVARALIPEPTRDMNLARKILREASLSDRGTALLPAWKSAVETLQRRAGTRKEIYFLTDAQASGWENLPEIVTLLEGAKKELHANLILLNDPTESNLAVSGLRLAGGLAPVDQPLRFEVQVLNAGRADASAVPVRLRVDADAPSDQAVIDSLPAGATKSVSLFTKIRAEGYHSVTAEIDGDRLGADDRRTMAVHATRRLRVLLVDGRPGREPRETATFYLRHALLPVSVPEMNDFYIEPVVVTPAEFGSTRLDEFAAVVLADVSDFSQSTTVALDQYLQRGGGVLVFPGAATFARFYNDVSFLPAQFGELLVAKDDELAFRLQAKDYEHPIATLWNDAAAGTLASARFMKAYALTPTNEARVVVRFADNTPAIVERTWGQGRVVQFASSADTAWNDLPVRPAFVPLVHRTLGAIVAQKNAAVNIAVGDRLAFRTADEALGKDAIIGQNDKDRQFRRVELVDGRPVLLSDVVELAGAYAVTIQTEPVTPMQFAAQADARESRLDSLPAAALARLAAVANVVEWQPDTPWKQTMKKQTAGHEIWRAILFAAVALAAVELLLGQRFSEPK